MMMNEKNTIESNKPSDTTENLMHESIRLLITEEWKDIHHTRLQEWSALGVVTGVHYALLQFIFKVDTLSGIPFHFGALPIIGAVFVILGIRLTFHHREIMSKKYLWLRDAENRLGLIQKDINDPIGIIPHTTIFPPPKEPKTKFGKSFSSTRVGRFVFSQQLQQFLASTDFLIICFYVLLIIFDSFLFFNRGVLFHSRLPFLRVIR
jgi:hypothetical protein